MDTSPGQPVPLAEAARRLGVSVESLRKRCQRGSVRAVQVDGRWRVYLDADGTASPSGPRLPASPSSPSADLAAVLAALSRVEAKLDALALERAVAAQEALEPPREYQDTSPVQAGRPWWRRWWAYLVE